MPTTAQLVKARIDRLLRRFTDPAQPKLIELISDVVEDTHGRIDDGDYGDPLRDTRPEFVKKDNEGWQ